MSIVQSSIDDTVNITNFEYSFRVPNMTKSAKMVP